MKIIVLFLALVLPASASSAPKRPLNGERLKISEPGTLSSFGIKEGDEILTIDGREYDDAVKIMYLLYRKNGKRFVEVKRGEKQLFFQIEVKR